MTSNHWVDKFAGMAHVVQVCILLCMQTWDFQDDCAVHIGWQSLRQRKAFCNRCVLACIFMLYAHRNTTDRQGQSVTNRRKCGPGDSRTCAGSAQHPLSARLNVRQHLKLCTGNSMPVYMMRAKVQGTIKKVTRALPSALAFAASTVASPDRAAVPCKPFQ